MGGKVRSALEVWFNITIPGEVDVNYSMILSNRIEYVESIIEVK